ncbi:hypothetical protein [Altericista sp. CCNU0014]|uniref:hypothetical protein n=1 Tax=Altericista sp. CCNU0014 TaxID=3082949 RepID=UPI00384C2D75
MQFLLLKPILTRSSANLLHRILAPDAKLRHNPQEVDVMEQRESGSTVNNIG